MFGVRVVLEFCVQEVTETAVSLSFEIKRCFRQKPLLPVPNAKRVAL